MRASISCWPESALQSSAAVSASSIAINALARRIRAHSRSVGALGGIGIRSGCSLIKSFQERVLARLVGEFVKPLPFGVETLVESCQRVGYAVTLVFIAFNDDMEFR